MSKMDDLRAMREARYAQGVARAAKAAPAAKPVTRPAAEPAPPVADRVGASASDGAGESGEADDQLCGHRAISGRTCTRERGHAAKSHRYS